MGAKGLREIADACSTLPNGSDDAERHGRIQASLMLAAGGVEQVACKSGYADQCKNVPVAGSAGTWNSPQSCGFRQQPDFAAVETASVRISWLRAFAKICCGGAH